MTDAVPVPLRFQIGARTLFAVRRRLARVPLGLGEALARAAAGAPPPLPPLEPQAHGYLVTSLPATLLEPLCAAAPRLRPWARQCYTRRYTDLTIGMDAWLARLAAKSRATLLRKERRFAEADGGAIDLRMARTPDEIGRFFSDARRISAMSYQERLLGAGMPEDGPRLLAEARADAVRGFILSLRGAPVSYLYLPAQGDTLLYAHLGFDPAAAALSPGSVLQLGALRLLMAERRFARLDFTEGEGQHKRLFATDGVPCLDLLLLRPGLTNWAAAAGLRAFDAGVARAKSAAAHPRLAALGKLVRR